MISCRQFWMWMNEFKLWMKKKTDLVEVIYRECPLGGSVSSALTSRLWTRLKDFSLGSLHVFLLCVCVFFSRYSRSAAFPSSFMVALCSLLLVPQFVWRGENGLLSKSHLWPSPPLGSLSWKLELKIHKWPQWIHMSCKPEVRLSLLA